MNIFCILFQRITGHALPKEVLLYFSYDKTLDQTSRSVLYKNILQYVNPSTQVYQTYVREMEQFAMEQLFAGRMNSALAVIYEHMLYKDMIDEKTAAILPRVLCSSRVKCENSAMKYVIVRCRGAGGRRGIFTGKWRSLCAGSV